MYYKALVHIQGRTPSREAAQKELKRTRLLRYRTNKFFSLLLCPAPFPPCAFNCLFFFCYIKCKLLPFIFKAHPTPLWSLSYFLGLRRGAPAFCRLSLHHLLIKLPNKWLCVFSYLSPRAWMEFPVGICEVISLYCFRNPSLKLSFAETSQKGLVISGAKPAASHTDPTVSLSLPLYGSRRLSNSCWQKRQRKFELLNPAPILIRFEREERWR